MKRIVFVLDGGLEGGGAERVATRLINGWVERGVHVTVVSLAGSRNEFYEISDQANRIYLDKIKPHSSFFSKVLHHISNMLKLRDAIRDNNSDVVLSFLTRTNIRVILASLGLGKRIVISERSDLRHQQYKWIWKALRYLFYRHADVITANTHIAIECMKRFVPIKKLVYIHNPITFPNLQAHPSTAKSILNVGRLIPLKSQILILEALSLTGVKDWVINILGDGPEETNLTSAAKTLGIENQLYLHGFVANTEDFYLDAGIFVLPSVYEGMSNALLEAMSYGLPCIVSNSLTGALEHIDHGVTGLIFESANINDLAEKLLLIINNPNLGNNLGLAARERMRQFTDERVFNDWDRALFEFV